MRSDGPYEGQGCALPALFILLTLTALPWLLMAGLGLVFIGAVREDVPALLGFVAFFQLGALLAGRSLTSQLNIDHLTFLGWLLASAVLVVVLGLALWVA